MISTYFQLGFWHILDFQGFDHLLFLAVLVAGISINEWKSLLTLITAFTLGHSLTLALTLMYGAILSAEWVEFLIPITILIAAVANVFWNKKRLVVSTVATLLFGFIHGMGFAGYLYSLLPTAEALWKPLLSFNLGVEAGQLLFASFLISLLTFLARYVSKPAVRIAQTSISIVGMGISILLASLNWIF